MSLETLEKICQLVSERSFHISKGSSRTAVCCGCAAEVPPHLGRHLRSQWLETLVLSSFPPFRSVKITWLRFHWDLNFGWGKALRSASVYPQMAIVDPFPLISIPQREVQKKPSTPHMAQVGQVSLCRPTCCRSFLISTKADIKTAERSLIRSDGKQDATRFSLR